MIDGEIRECPECGSTEIVVHKRDVAAVGEPLRTFVSGYECVECGRRWQPEVELTGQNLKPVGRYS
jgi:DNA-directed RNA polymerase subunit M/transcription elongation factor TFIIS